MAMKWLKKLFQNEIEQYEFGVHYDIASDVSKEYWLPIKVLKGPYAGSIFSFENLKFQNVIIDGVPKLQPTFSTIVIKGRIDNHVAWSIWFDVAPRMLEKHLEAREAVRSEVMDDDETSGTDYIEEPFEQRGLRKKSGSVPSQRVRSRQK